MVDGNSEEEIIGDGGMNSINNREKLAYTKGFRDCMIATADYAYNMDEIRKLADAIDRWAKDPYFDFKLDLPKHYEVING